MMALVTLVQTAAWAVWIATFLYASYKLIAGGAALMAAHRTRCAPTRAVAETKTQVLRSAATIALLTAGAVVFGAVAGT